MTFLRATFRSRTLLVHGLPQGSLDQIAHMINNCVRVFFRSQPVEQYLHLKLGDVVERDVFEGRIDVAIEVVEVGAARRLPPVGAAHGDVDIPHPIAEGDGPSAARVTGPPLMAPSSAPSIFSASGRCIFGL